MIATVQVPGGTVVHVAAPGVPPWRIVYGVEATDHLALGLLTPSASTRTR